jgi:hypothetical protein
MYNLLLLGAADAGRLLAAAQGAQREAAAVRSHMLRLLAVATGRAAVGADASGHLVVQPLPPPQESGVGGLQQQQHNHQRQPAQAQHQQRGNGRASMRGDDSRAMYGPLQPRILRDSAAPASVEDGSAGAGSGVSGFGAESQRRAFDSPAAAQQVPPLAPLQESGVGDGHRTWAQQLSQSSGSDGAGVYADLTGRTHTDVVGTDILRLRLGSAANAGGRASVAHTAAAPDAIVVEVEDDGEGDGLGSHTHTSPYGGSSQEFPAGSRSVDLPRTVSGVSTTAGAEVRGRSHGRVGGLLPVHSPHAAVAARAQHAGGSGSPVGTGHHPRFSAAPAAGNDAAVPALRLQQATGWRAQLTPAFWVAFVLLLIAIAVAIAGFARPA